ncbi:ATP-binding cassette domain-containing protein [Gordonia amarae]|uniref:ATP-binding cassette domain-containing protein n=2 Tax=Gordonia amarae TaxID=36821 RepID=A0A857KMB8_9ACTN|nr:ATP-binding cassette domain-containing protein [Gordonia amarae]MCS3880008.1 branched-chain amino acid transport system ATP-binding protein [Gordonia amarae]QHN18393.1 ATP-binding cassette domain-containing protein [Gordonia amarae]QHN22875.1 ATP-binding cassette domain-containing protein [Gordonia amarae]QHN31778.1 ATP-binding cassette domain-containing protein [Gordonia amarae]QHN40524.1 ATP-binding cassette domain-containing protein [Gordonia amarae]
MSILQCRGLSAGYAPSSPVVRGLDLSIGEGEIVALLGPNGAGKTTLLTTLAGLLPRLGGQVEVAGTALPSGNARAAVRAGLVLVADDRALFRKLSTEQNLALAVAGGRWNPAAARAARRSAVDGVLQFFPSLKPRLKVAAGQLSGGEQQMLAIGRALVQKPKVLLIDELSMGLAPVIVESILPVLRDVAAAGTSVILVEQHVRMALQVADRGVVLTHGEVVLSDEAATLSADLGRVERAYLGGTPTLT